MPTQTPTERHTPLHRNRYMYVVATVAEPTLSHWHHCHFSAFCCCVVALLLLLLHFLVELSFVAVAVVVRIVFVRCRKSNRLFIRHHQSLLNKWSAGWWCLTRLGLKIFSAFKMWARFSVRTYVYIYIYLKAYACMYVRLWTKNALIWRWRSTLFVKCSAFTTLMRFRPRQRIQQQQQQQQDQKQ